MFKYLSLSFLLSILLIRMPPFYVFPIIQSSLLTSHTLARVLILGLFLVMIWRKDYIKVKPIQVKLFGIYLGYLFFHSLSLVNVVNFDSFLLRYKDVVFPGLFLLLSFVYLRSKYDFVKVLVISLIINFIYQAIAFLSPSLFNFVANILIYEGHRDFVMFNLARGRIFIETYDEIVFPFLFVFGLYSGVKGSIYKQLLSLMIIVPTFLSNFRSRLLMLVVSIGLTFMSWFRSWRTVVGMGLVAIVLFFAADTLSLRLLGFSMLDRVLLRSNHDDIQSLTSRWEGIAWSFKLGVDYPIAGIGLGNFFEYLPSDRRDAAFLLATHNGSVWISAMNPHNIFAQIVSETGELGLMYYIAMILFFLIMDIKILGSPRKSDFATASVIAFWSLFSYSLFNPSATLIYNMLFWILRSMVIYENTD